MKKMFLFFLLILLVIGGVFASGKKEDTKGDSASVTESHDVDLGGRELRIVAWWDPTETNQIRLSKIAQLEKKYNFKLSCI